MQFRRKLNTREAAEYLCNLGLKVTSGTMEVWRCLGRGPRYRKINNSVLYDTDDLDLFAQGRVVETIDSRSWGAA